MSELQIFKNAEFGFVRTITVEGEPYFVAKDVTGILGYANASKAIADHVDEEDKLNNESLSSLGQRGGWLINESGLYSLILSSKMPNAKKFKRWVTSEVLPTIRRHGLYAMDEVLANPDILINALLELKAERERNANLQAVVAVQNHLGMVVIAVCCDIGAKLNIDETKDLLSMAGYALSPCDKRDIIFSFFIENNVHDMIEIDIALEEHGLPCFIE